MFKRIFVAVALIATPLILMAQSQRVILDKVVAVVGSSSILHSDVEGMIYQINEKRKSQGYTSDQDLFSEAFEFLLEQKLLYNQGMIDSVFVNPIDIENRVEQYVQGMIAQEGGVVEVERKHGLAIYNIRDNIRRRYEEQAYAQAMQSRVLNGTSVVPGDVHLFYKNKDKDSLPIIGEQYVYAQITRYPSHIEEAKFRVRERLLDMRQRIISGSISFSALARMYSVDPGSAYRGGEMEPMALSAFDPDFAEMLGSLQVDQVSEIVESQYGFHIIQLIEKRGELYHARHILLRPVFTDDELLEPTNYLDSLAGMIRVDSISFEQAAKLYSEDSYSKMNGGIVSNHDLLERYNAYDAKLTVTKFLKEDFGNRGYKSIDDFTALSKLKLGEISPAFSTEDIRGNTLSKVVKLVNIIPAHTASLSEDYLRIEEMALEAKQQIEYSKWLSKRIDAMYVHIAPEYRDLDFKNKNWVK